MNEVFLDANGLIGWTNPRDQWHRAAVEARRLLSSGTRIVTTYEVLTEYLSHYAAFGPYLREQSSRMVRSVFVNPQFRIIEDPARVAFFLGLDLYERRRDKQYSLVDCISMAVMRREGITHVLTNDHHFEQEGFTLLIRR
ncbi:MAG: PIN domain-containing protein [Armatimonadetes bacterium]|nr:PIN domain-containing protein [Armatimonadota bacterium]